MLQPLLGYSEYEVIIGTAGGEPLPPMEYRLTYVPTRFTNTQVHTAFFYLDWKIGNYTSRRRRSRPSSSIPAAAEAVAEIVIAAAAAAVVVAVIVFVFAVVVVLVVLVVVAAAACVTLHMP